MSNTKWDQMLELARQQQQEYYELLPEWTKYKEDEYKYLQQNIGFALFGPPTESTEITESNILLNEDEKSKHGDIINAFEYKKEAQKVIKTVYDKVKEFGHGSVEEKYIYYGIIFNVTIHPPIPNLDKIKNSSMDEKKKETKGNKSSDTEKEKKENEKVKATRQNKSSDTEKEKEENEKVKATGQNKSSDTEKEKEKSEKPEVNLYTTPIFKVLKSENTVWYIDIHGRVYKSWMDYKESNTLPKCTMVLPMDGFYKADCRCMLNEDSSSVWLDILESPACSVASTVLSVTDTSTSIVGMVGLGLSVATFFTPAAPLAIGALAATGVSGVWATGRAVHNLVDRSTHKESINVTNRNAFCSWLTITGGAVGLAASGGNVVLNRFVQSGSAIGRAPQMAYNALLLGNLGVNGFGLAYQAYCMYESYQEGREIRVIDLLSLSTHLLFFGSAVVNMQFAGDLIESTQGRILDDYRSTIRSKNLRKQFNRAKRTAAANNVDKMSENAEVIRYINRKTELRLANNMDPSNNTSNNNIVLFDNGIIKVCGYSLLDPIKFVTWLIKLDESVRRGNYSSSSSTSRDDGETADMVSKLKNLLSSLLSNFSQNHRTKNLPTVDEFNSTFEDMKFMKNGLLAFNLIFQIATALIEHNSEIEEYIVQAVHFVWCYVKESVRTNGLTVIFSVGDETIQRALERILKNMLDHLDAIEERLLPAVQKYIHEYLKILFST